MRDEEMERTEKLLVKKHEAAESDDLKISAEATADIVKLQEQQTKSELAAIEWQKVVDQKELKEREFDIREKELELEKQKIKADTVKMGMSLGGTVVVAGLFAFMDAHGHYVSEAVKTAIGACKSLLFKKH